MRRYLVSNYGTERAYWFGFKYNGKWYWRVPLSNRVYSPGRKAWLSDTWMTLKLYASVKSRRLFRIKP